MWQKNYKFCIDFGTDSVCSQQIVIRDLILEILNTFGC